jgi:hypothetical protein
MLLLIKLELNVHANIQTNIWDLSQMHVDLSGGTNYFKLPLIVLSELERNTGAPFANISALSESSAFRETKQCSQSSLVIAGKDFILLLILMISKRYFQSF